MKPLETLLRSAVISDCGLHRLLLARRWDDRLPTLCWIMLNPSTADGTAEDASSRKVRAFTERLGFGSFYIVNLWTYRATNPIELKRAGYPNHKDADLALDLALLWSDAVVCGWGRNGASSARAAEVVQRVRDAGKTPQALRLSPDGTPWHPLYLPGASELVAMP